MSNRLSRRQFLSLVGTTLPLGILAAACTPVAPAAPSAGDTAGQAGKIELVYSTWGGGNWQNFIDMFNESQGEIHAIFEQIAYDAYREKMLTDFAAGESADIAEIGASWMPEFGSRDMLTPLDDYMANDATMSIDNWLPGTFLPNLQVIDGKTLGLPSGDSPKVIWFNPDLFSEFGVRTPLEYEAEGEWNWTSFLEVAIAMTRGEGADKHYAYRTWMGRTDTDDIMRSFGGGWTDQDVTEVWCTKPESVEGLQFILDLYLEHKAAPLAQELEAMGGDTQMFMTQRLAMYMSGVWEVYGLRQTEGLAYDVAPLPEGPSGRFMYHSPNAVAIPRTTSNADAAWQLLSYLKSPELEKVMVQGEGFMPFMKASVETFLTNGYIPNAQLFIDALEKGWGHPLPNNENSARIDQLIGDAIGLALSEGGSAQAVVDEVEPQLQSLVG